MPEPSFIAPLVPRTAADEWWHLRAELRDAANQSLLNAAPALVLMLVVLAQGVSWLGPIIPIGLFLGGRKARIVADRPRAGAGPGPLRTPALTPPPTPYEVRLCAVLVAQDGRQQFRGVLIAGTLLAFGDLLRIPLSVVAVPSRITLLNSTLVVGVALACSAAFCGYWGVLGGRYLAARRMVATGDTLAEAAQHERS